MVFCFEIHVIMSYTATINVLPDILDRTYYFIFLAALFRNGRTVRVRSLISARKRPPGASR